MKQTISVYEIDGKETMRSDLPTIGIDSHWDDKSLVCLVIDGKSYAVLANDLLTAVTNATNS